jgi:hypothetical protein
MAAGKKYPLTELQNIIGDIIGSTRWATAIAHLFTTDVTPALSDTVGSYSSFEAGWVGYVAQAVAMGSPANDGTRGYSDSVIINYTVTSGGSGVTVYGYYITDAASANLLFAERIASPISVIDGFPVPLQVRIRDVNA